MLGSPRGLLTTTGRGVMNRRVTSSASSANIREKKGKNQYSVYLILQFLKFIFVIIREINIRVPHLLIFIRESLSMI